MRIVNISDLKARLSSHIEMVKNGEEVLVCDRNKPVARIVSCSGEDEPERERRLIARGVLVPPKKTRRSPLTAPAGEMWGGGIGKDWGGEGGRLRGVSASLGQTRP